VLGDAHAQIAAAKAETLAEIEKSAASTDAFARTISERDDAEIAKANLEIENSALRIKSLQVEREQASKRVAVAKAVQVDIEKAEDAAIASEVASTVAVIAYLWKSVRHCVTGQSFIDRNAKKSSGPWECIDPSDGRVIIAETRQDAIDIATDFAMRAREKSVPSEDDPVLNRPAADSKKPRRYPDVGEDMGSNDTYDAKAKSERVPVSKSVGGKRKPKWAR